MPVIEVEVVPLLSLFDAHRNTGSSSASPTRLARLGPSNANMVATTSAPKIMETKVKWDRMAHASVISISRLRTGPVLFDSLDPVSSQSPIVVISP